MLKDLRKIRDSVGREKLLKYIDDDAVATFEAMNNRCQAHCFRSNAKLYKVCHEPETASEYEKKRIEREQKAAQHKTEMAELLAAKRAAQA